MGRNIRDAGFPLGENAWDIVGGEVGDAPAGDDQVFVRSSCKTVRVYDPSPASPNRS